MLHVLDGDATRPAFDAARLPGEAVVWREALIEGGWPRALRGVDDALHAAREAAMKDHEIVLWFDTDLFCRLHAAYFAAHFVGARMTNAIGSHADRTDMRALYDRRFALDPAIAEAWHAYASPDPRGLVPLAQRFPWLRLHLERFPSTDDGLNALERRALQVLLDEGPMPFGQLFRRVARDDFSATSFGLADLHLQTTLAELGPLVGRGEKIAITHEGRECLAGRVDRTEIAPLDRWLGGVQLTGRGAWRWDGERLVAR